MKSLSELELKDEPLPAGSLEDMPEFGGFSAPPQPGPYRFRLPSDLTKVWDVFDVTSKGQRVKMVFDRDNPLLIIQSFDGKSNGDTFQTRLSNMERKRGKDGPELSDLDYLLKALEPTRTDRPKSNKAYIESLKGHGGKEFAGDISYNYSCNEQKKIRAYVGEQLQELDKMGCGWRYYTGTGTPNPAKKTGYVGKQADGTYPTEVTCQCGAVLRAFANLDNIRA